jgi:cytochrome c
MSLLGLPGHLSHETRRETGAPTSWEMDLSIRPRAKTCAEGLDEWSAHASRRRRKKYAAVVLAVAISALAERAWAGSLTGDAARGETLYEACQDCHSLDKNDVGPRHRGVFGRKAASLPDYDYSDALKSANILWNEETLDKWLTDPQAVAPGAKMFFHLDNPQDRADVIAYLKERAK